MDKFYKKISNYDKKNYKIINKKFMIKKSNFDKILHLCLCFMYISFHLVYAKRTHLMKLKFHRYMYEKNSDRH